MPLRPVAMQPSSSSWLRLAASRHCAALLMCLGPPLGTHMGGRSVGQKKIRHHVNPLKSVHMKPLALPNRWPEQQFAQPSQPLHVDIGCARGVFCLDLATACPDINVVGLEIRALLAETATEDAKGLGLSNAAFFGTNANVNLDNVLSSAAPSCELRSVSIQCAHAAP